MNQPQEKFYNHKTGRNVYTCIHVQGSFTKLTQYTTLFITTLYLHLIKTMNYSKQMLRTLMFLI